MLNVINLDVVGQGSYWFKWFDVSLCDVTVSVHASDTIIKFEIFTSSSYCNILRTIKIQVQELNLINELTN